MMDAVVIGAGPSGCVAARDLARVGARVAIVDGSHPREKPCGGGVTGRALSIAGPSATGLAGRSIRQVRFEAGGRGATVAVDDPDTLRIFDRRAFDTALLDEATAAGATHVRERAVRCRPVAGGWDVSIGDRTLRAAWLLGADGACGITRKQLAGAFDRADISIASGSYVDGVSTDDVVIGFTETPRGYLWSFPRRDHLAVGTCAQADTTSSAGMHASTDAWLDGYAPARGHARRRYSWPIPSLRAESFDRQPTSGPRWMLLGDAAGLVDPITREGIYFALASGVHAACALSSADPARAYDVRIRGDVHPELRLAARLKEAVFRPRFTRLLVDALESSAAIRGVMIDLIAGRQPYARLKRRLLGTLEFGLMVKLLFNTGAA